MSDTSLDDYYYAYDSGYTGSYSQWMAEQQGATTVVDAGGSSGDQSNVWDLGVAILDNLGNVTQLLDSNGNDVSGSVDQAHVVDNSTADSSTLYWILGAAAIVMLIAVAFLIYRKKK